MQQYPYPPYPPPPYTQREHHNSQNQAAEFQLLQHIQNGFEEAAREQSELEGAVLPAYEERQSNWPPYPKCCCLTPFAYQDIDVEIPTARQETARQLYAIWMYHEAVLLLNFIGGSVVLLHTGRLTTYILSILYLVLLTPLSYLCWYRPAYRALRDNRSLDYTCFFVSCFLQFLISCFIVGETCNLYLAIRIIKNRFGSLGDIVGFFVLLIASGFGIAAFLDLVLLYKVFKIYRTSGASFAKTMAGIKSTNLFVRFNSFVYAEPVQQHPTISQSEELSTVNASLMLAPVHNVYQKQMNAELASTN